MKRKAHITNYKLTKQNIHENTERDPIQKFSLFIQSTLGKKNPSQVHIAFCYIYYIALHYIHAKEKKINNTVTILTSSECT